MKDTKNEEIVYHYCSISTFLNIMKNCSLWMTEVEKSNDYAERRYIEEKIKDQFKEIAKVDLELKQIPEGTIDKCYDMIYSSLSVYACCLSEEGDLLSQWRAYADNGFGVSIGVSRNILEDLNNEPYGLSFFKVIYDLEEQYQYISDQVSLIKKTMEYKNFYASSAEVFENNAAKNSCMKNPAFSEEKEWRLCIGMAPECRIGVKGKFKDMEMSEIKLYSNDRKITSYCDLSFEKKKRDFIKRIYLGPNCKMKENDMTHILNILGFNANDIEILPSQASYRA